MADECTRMIEIEVKRQLTLKEFKVSGSYSRDTAIHPFNDVDLLVELPYAYFKPEYEGQPIILEVGYER